MCKQKLKLGLLVCSLSFGQAFSLELELQRLTSAFQDLSSALQLAFVPPVPPRDDEGITHDDSDVVPPPVPLREGEIKLISVDQLPFRASDSALLQKASEKKSLTKSALPDVTNVLVTQDGEKSSGDLAQLPVKIGGISAPGMKTPSFTPSIKIKPTQKMQAATAVPTLEISMAGHLSSYLHQLGAMPMETRVQKSERKAFARGILNGILSWVTKKKVDKVVVMPALQTLLAVDPMLISTAALVLEKVGANSAEIYSVMISLYQNRVNYIGQEIKKLKDGKIEHSAVQGQVFAGIREDIDDAVAYPIELEGALSHAKNRVALAGPNIANAQDFIKQMADLKIELCKHIIQNIELFDPMYRNFYRSFCDLGAKPSVVYCELVLTPQQKKDKSRTYISLDDAITDVLTRVEAFNAHRSQYWASKKTFELQYIVNTLVSFIDFFNDPKFCKACLQSDIYRMQQSNYAYHEKLQYIKRFLLSVADAENNDYLRSVAVVQMPRLERLLVEQEAEVIKQVFGAGDDQF